MNAKRDALAELPRADNVKPGEVIDPEDVYVVAGHRGVFDPDRTLVVANRGMGKSLWAHALREPKLRDRVADRLRLEDLPAIGARLAFHGGVSSEGGAPTPDMLGDALSRGFTAREIFHGIVLKHLADTTGDTLPDTFIDRLTWLRAFAEKAADIRARADRGGRLILLFDGLDRLAGDWATTRSLLKGLLEVALEVQSLRNVRLKLFLRRDQYEDSRIFDFRDSSKLKNTRVELAWGTHDLYGLLFFRLARIAPATFLPSTYYFDFDTAVAELAGTFMGADHRRGRVLTWVPTHLADARGEIAPRTFLTAWREAAHAVQNRPPASQPTTAVDPKAIHEGVQLASEDRMSELSEDYPWVQAALDPLKGRAVPMMRTELEAHWSEAGTLDKVSRRSGDADRPIWIPLLREGSTEADKLMGALQLIAVLENRPNGKVNIPDIFRVFAGIKRRGGVPPKRPTG